MTDAFAVVDEAAAWISDRRAALESQGRTVNVSSGGDRSKTSISISIDYKHRISQLIIWDSGESQLMRADVLQDIDRDEYREIHTPEELLRTLGDFAAWTSAVA